MAFGKKDKDEQPTAAEAEAPGSETAELEPTVAEVAAEEVPAEPEPAATAPESTDALLSMFASTEAEAEDITLLLDLAGDIDIDDLLEELSTVAAALGIDTSGRVDYEEEEALAA